jgi:hypothetical protein
MQTKSTKTTINSVPKKTQTKGLCLLKLERQTIIKAVLKKSLHQNNSLQLFQTYLDMQTLWEKEVEIKLKDEVSHFKVPKIKTLIQNQWKYKR